MNDTFAFLKFICVLLIILNISISLIYLGMAQDVIKENEGNFKGNSLNNIAKSFLLISSILNLVYFVAFIFYGTSNNLELVMFFVSTFMLLFQIPMTVIYWTKIKNGEDVVIGFKVCALLFANLVAGIFMLCDTKGVKK